MSKPVPFGKYFLLERINVGGMAEVFKAKAYGVDGFEKLLAIKRILPNIAEDADFIRMFVDEAKIAAQLNHANVAQIYDLGKVGDSYFIAMEYVDGVDARTMFEVMRRQERKLPLDVTLYVMAEICEGLDYAHRRAGSDGQPLRIVHRDVSPQNILVSFDGDVKLIDFGIAKAAVTSQKTQAGFLKGKFGYMSPEQVTGDPLDRRCDVFSLGTVVYELLTGERLFQGASDFSTLEKVRKADIPPLSRRNPDVEPKLEALVMKALRRDIDERWAWAGELGKALRQYMMKGGHFMTKADLGEFMRREFTEVRERRSRGFTPTPSPDAQTGPPPLRPDETTGNVLPLLSEQEIVNPTSATNRLGPKGAPPPLPRGRRSGPLDQPPPLSRPPSLPSSDIADREVTPTSPPPEIYEDTLDPLPEPASDVATGRRAPAPPPLRRGAAPRAPERDETTSRRQRPGPNGAPAGEAAPELPEVAAAADVADIDGMPTPVGPADPAALGVGPFDTMSFRRQRGRESLIARLGPLGLAGIAVGALLLAALAWLVGPKLFGGPVERRVQIHSRPPGAQVIFNGKALSGVTPVELAVLPGLHQLEVRLEGFRPHRGEVRIAEDAPSDEVIAENVTLAREAPPPILVLTSDPSGARISVGGEDEGKTPLTLRGLRAEEEIRVVADMRGYKPRTEMLRLQPGEKRALNLVLRPLLGTLTVVTRPPGATLFVDGVARGTTPVTVEDLQVTGSFDLRISRRGYEIWEQRFDMLGQVEQTLTLDLEPDGRRRRRSARDNSPGVLQVTSDPWARVWVNGRDTGHVTPLLKLELSPGKHTITLKNKRYGCTEDFEVNIRPGKTTRMNKKLRCAQ